MRRREFRNQDLTPAVTLMQQLLTENLLLSLVGCAFGLALAFLGIRLFVWVIPAGFPELLRHSQG